MFRYRSLQLALILLCASQVAQGQDAASFSLEGTNWQLTRLTVPGGFEFVPDDPGKYVLNFRSENRLTGNSDCNRILGSWHQEEEGAVYFEPFAAGRSLCPPGSLHNNFALYMRSVVAYERSDEMLVLTTTIDGVVLEFEQR